MEIVGVIVIVALVAIFFAVVVAAFCWAGKAAEQKSDANEEQERKPKLNPPSEGAYYTSKQDRMLTDEELQQMDEKGWVLVNVIPESYHDYLGCYPEAPMVLRTRYTYLFRRIKQAELK